MIVKRLTSADFEPGQAITIYGWQDGKSKKDTADTHTTRRATVVKAYDKFLLVRYSAGYMETWSYNNLLYALNGLRIPAYYSKADGHQMPIGKFV